MRVLRRIDLSVVAKEVAPNTFTETHIVIGYNQLGYRDELYMGHVIFDQIEEFGQYTFYTINHEVVEFFKALP